MYREFLLYTNFYAAETSVLLCEGKTDNVYLTHAIRSLAKDFPDLAEITPDKIRLKVRLYKVYRRPSSIRRPASTTARILSLGDGGSSGLGGFIRSYKQETDRFKVGGQKSPVIILYDHDSGAKDIRGALKAYGKTVNGKEQFVDKEQFVHVVRNLYAVPTPLVNGVTESKMEDFFDATAKGIKIGGKTFSAENQYDREKYYGKNEFAQQVVRVGAATINFEGFRPLLTNLAAVIRWHAANNSSDVLSSRVMSASNP